MEYEKIGGHLVPVWLAWSGLVRSRSSPAWSSASSTVGRDGPAPG